jgi:hypothetical protein
MAKMRRRYDREFKISILAELLCSNPLAQVACEYGIHPSADEIPIGKCNVTMHFENSSISFTQINTTVKVIQSPI